MPRDAARPLNLIGSCFVRGASRCSSSCPVRISDSLACFRIYILVGVVGGIVFVGAVVGAVYYQRSQRRTDAPHLPTSYKQKQAFSRQERSDSYTSDDEVRCLDPKPPAAPLLGGIDTTSTLLLRRVQDTSIGHRSSKDRKKSYQYGAVGVC